jgi:hypothetical protein
MDASKEQIKAYLDRWEYLLEKAPKEEIIAYLVEGAPPSPPILRETIKQQFEPMSRDEVVSFIKARKVEPVKAPDKDCPVCGEKMRFEASCFERVQYGILGKYLCLQCMKFELYTKEP